MKRNSDKVPEKYLKKFEGKKHVKTYIQNIILMRSVESILADFKRGSVLRVMDRCSIIKALVNKIHSKKVFISYQEISFMQLN